jgi:DNA-binding GntR family transcriptional regulator
MTFMSSAEIADDLAARITADPPEYAPGARLNYSDLAQLYGVSKDTIKRAALLLRDRGLAYYYPGRGVFVTDPDAPPPGPRPRSR